MSVSKIATSAVMALSLAVPTLVQAAPAASRLAVSAPASVAVARVGARTASGNQARGGSSILLLVLGLAAVGAGIYAATSNNNKRPTSA